MNEMIINNCVLVLVYLYVAELTYCFLERVIASNRNEKELQK